MAALPVPPRRFQPQPVETTTKSSRKALVEPVETAIKNSLGPNMEQSDTTSSCPTTESRTTEPTRKGLEQDSVNSTVKSTRRFAADPVETTAKSSRRFVAQPVETVTTSRRKFAPESLETSTKSTRKSPPQPDDDAAKSTRRYAPEPMETSGSGKMSRHDDESPSNTRRKFSPQPIETTSRSNHSGAADQVRSSRASEKVQQAGAGVPAEDGDKPPARRKFAPQLIETAKRTRRKSDESPALLPSDMTEVTPGDAVDASTNSRQATLATSQENTRISGQSNGHLDLSRTGQHTMRVQASTRTRAKRHSFRVPDLAPIESSESDRTNSDASDPPSLTESLSTSSEMSQHYKHATRMRETVDEQFTGYLLSLAQQAAEKQLREQAMAAFPNSDYHEGVAHYVDHDLDDDDDVDVEDQVLLLPHERLGLERTRGASEAEVALAARHFSQYQRGRSSRTESKEGKVSAVNPWGKISVDGGNDASGAPQNIIGGWQRNIGLTQMRTAASPPMLGRDITFPRCPSPEPVRFDVMHGSTHLRNNMCYLTEQTQAEPEGLWDLAKGSKNRGGSGSTSQGLWGGFCVGKDSRLPTGPIGIMTPRQGSMHAEHVDMKTHHRSHAPSPLHSMSTAPVKNEEVDVDIIREKLMKDKLIEEEFNDSFVTQVYNYLSLGYPSIARKYDEELSKITKVAMEDLRKDDRLVSARGYIRLGDDTDGTADSHDTKVVPEEISWRWKALRMYIREWAKQQPKMKYEGNAMGAWGFTARRGSWAI